MASITTTVSKPFQILCFGDSLTEGYYVHHDETNGYQYLIMHPYAQSLMNELNTNPIPDGYDSISCNPIGFSGYKTSQLEKLMENNKDEYLLDVDMMIVMSGTNDIATTNLDDVIDSLTSIHQHAWDRGIPTIAMTIPESRVTTRPGRFMDRRIEMNRMIQTHVSTKNNLCHFVDNSKFVPYHVDSENPLWGKDGLHMNIDGYTKFGYLLSSHIYPIISEYVKQKSTLGNCDNDANNYQSEK